MRRSACLQLRRGRQVVHLVQGAGEAVEQRHGVGVAAGFPRRDRDDNPGVTEERKREPVRTVGDSEKPKLGSHKSPGRRRPPVVSDPVEEAVAVVHHGSDGAEDGGVAHQTGRQYKVSTASAADKPEVQFWKVGGLGFSGDSRHLTTGESVVSRRSLFFLSVILQRCGHIRRENDPLIYSFTITPLVGVDVTSWLQGEETSRSNGVRSLHLSATHSGVAEIPNADSSLKQSDTLACFSATQHDSGLLFHSASWWG